MADLVGPEGLGGERRLEVRHRVHGHLVARGAPGEHHGRAAAGGVGAHVHAGGREQPLTEAQSDGRVVVAADDDDRHPQVGEAAERLVQQGHRLDRRDGSVVDVAGHHHGVDAGVGGHLDQVVDEGGLGVEQALAVQRAAQVPVGGVEEPHAGDCKEGV